MQISPPQSYTFDNIPPRKIFHKVSGIYGIHCVVSNKWYIGQTEDLHHRLSSYKNNLRTNTRENKHLRRAYHKYGKTAFEIFVLKLCSKDELDKFEKYYMDLYNSINPYLGYNICYFDENGKPQYKESFHERVKNPKTKIRFGDAKVIRELYSEGYTPKFIYTIYKIDNRHLSKILGNHVWRDESYEKPKTVPDLNIEQRGVVEKYILQGKSANEIIRLTGIYWKRIHFYLKKAKRSTKLQHTMTILDQQTGVYYTNLAEASEAKCISPNKLRNWLTVHPNRNKSSLILVDTPTRKPATKPLILDTQTGIYYSSYREVAKLHCVTPRTITRWLTDLPKYNKTSLILC